ncbi:MAG: peptide chain release factor N(5)-glutamine methyltransferase [Chloroflexi bacterium]|nr:peptide chain release factor N(5)-glutamine methyltransferase [Chloroflexota bacterium]
MTWHQAVRHASAVLASYGIEVPRLEAELLVLEALRQAETKALRQVAGEQALSGAPTGRQAAFAEDRPAPGRSWLYAHLQDEFPSTAQQALDSLLERRLAGEPLAYIRGHKEFFGLDFLVDRRVLIPRPETETLVEAALEWSRRGRDWPGPCLAADVGTGCGAIAVSLAVNLPQAVIYATDISEDALAVAEANAQRHGVADRVHFRRGDLLGPLPHPFPLITANLPYVAACDWPSLSREVTGFEPRQALHGGQRGLGVIRRLLEQAPGRLLAGGCLLLELGFGQGQPAMELAHAQFPEARIRLLPDMAGTPRVLRIETTEAHR